jgi:hypothetical protein
LEEVGWLAVKNVELEKAASDAAQYVAEAKLGVVRQRERVARLRALGLPTEKAKDTLDVLQGTVAATECFEDLLRGLLSHRRQVQDREPRPDSTSAR